MSTPQNAPIAFVELGSDDPILFPAGNNVVDYRAWAMGVVRSLVSEWGEFDTGEAPSMLR